MQYFTETEHTSSTNTILLKLINLGFDIEEFSYDEEQDASFLSLEAGEHVDHGYAAEAFEICPKTARNIAALGEHLEKPSDIAWRRVNGVERNDVGQIVKVYACGDFEITYLEGIEVHPDEDFFILEPFTMDSVHIKLVGTRVEVMEISEVGQVPVLA